MTKATTESRIVKAILADLTDRSGLRQAWEYIDDDIQNEIKAEWAALVRKELDAQQAVKVRDL